MPYALVSIGRLGREQLIGEYARRSEALRARDDLFEQNAGRVEEAYLVYDEDREHEWDDETFCAWCQDVRVKDGGLCAECTQAEAEYWAGEELSKKASYLMESGE